jgi:hypothetical protein
MKTSSTRERVGLWQVTMWWERLALGLCGALVLLALALTLVVLRELRSSSFHRTAGNAAGVGAVHR